MRETDFIKQNKEKWLEFEDILKKNQKDPDKLSNLFVQVTDDLSFSRTFYKNRSVRVYLNVLAQRVFYHVYKKRQTRKGGFLNFWTNDLPKVNWECRKEFLVSFLVFAVSVVIGVLSSVQDPDFPRVILGDDYVDMTLRNIRNNDPMAVYKQGNEFFDTAWIGVNNLRVAMLIFMAGFFFYFGSIAVIMFNGIMVGAFQMLFFQNGVYEESMLAIWLHGTMEMLSMVVAGAAGLALGKGLVFPGTFTRLQSLQISARQGLKIFLSVLPFIVIAAVIESFFTRHTDISNVLRFLVILFSFVLMIGYYIIFPWLRFNADPGIGTSSIRMPPTRTYNLDFINIKNAGEIFKDSFLFYRRHVIFLLTTSFIFSGLAAFYIRYSDPFFFSLSADNFLAGMKVLSFETKSIVIPCWIIIFTFYLFYVNRKVAVLSGAKLHSKKPAAIASDLLKSLGVSLILTGFLFMFRSLPGAAYFLFAAPVIFLIAIPYLNMMLFSMIRDRSFFGGMKQGIRLVNEGFSRTAGVSASLAVIGLIFVLLFSSPAIGIFQWAIQLLAMDPESAADFIQFVYLFFGFFSICLVIPLFIASQALMFFSLREIREAVKLKEMIGKIGEKNNETITVLMR